MHKILQKIMCFYLFLFLLPILMIKLPILAFQIEETEQLETKPVAFAANEKKEVTKSNTKEVSMKILDEPIQILLYFTHSHESYQPIVQKSSGLKAVNYHPSKNITNVSALITQHLQLNGATVDVLPYDNMKEMKASNRGFSQAYSVIRPVLQKQLVDKSYDIVLDIHRDSAKHKATTLTSNNESYARIAFVVGAEHLNFKLNEAYAKSLSAEVNQIVPNISRGVMKKTKDDGNGIYNQDLSPKSILIELGGIENTEEEINRTIAILAKAISNVSGNAKAN